MPRTDEENVERLQEIRDQLIDRIGSITAKPKPTYDIDGQMVKWAEYLDILRKQLKDINEMIANEDGPFEIETQGYC